MENTKKARGTSIESIVANFCCLHSMIIKIAAFIFDPLTNKLSRYITF